MDTDSASGEGGCYFDKGDHKKYHKGRYIYDVHKFVDFLIPLSEIYVQGDPGGLALTFGSGPIWLLIWP